MQGLQDACNRQQASIAEALPPTITHMKSGAQVRISQRESSCSVSPVNHMSTEASTQHQTKSAMCTQTPSSLALVQGLTCMMMRQGLLAATSASVRLAQKRAQTERPRLQSVARREKLQAALIDAQTAVGAALELIQGAGRLAPKCFDRDMTPQ